jgi:small subunit ribosomal protein S20
VAKKKVSSAEKAHRQSVKRRDHNRQQRSKLRTALKAIRAAIDESDLAGAKAPLKDAFSLVDKMANKGIIHKNTAGRYKSRLVKRVVTTKSA